LITDLFAMDSQGTFLTDDFYDNFNISTAPCFKGIA